MMARRFPLDQTSKSQLKKKIRLTILMRKRIILTMKTFLLIQMLTTFLMKMKMSRSHLKKLNMKDNWLWPLRPRLKDFKPSPTSSRVLPSNLKIQRLHRQSSLPLNRRETPQFPHRGPPTMPEKQNKLDC